MWLLLIAVFYLFFIYYVLYKSGCWFVHSDLFYTSHFVSIYSLLCSESQSSTLKVLLCPITAYSSPYVCMHFFYHKKYLVEEKVHIIHNYKLFLKYFFPFKQTSNLREYCKVISSFPCFQKNSLIVPCTL